MDERQTPKVHKLMLTNRNNCTLCGVIDILSFDVNEVLMETEQGMLMVKGKDLHVSRLSLEKGEVDMEGHVDLLQYSDIHHKSKQGESLFGRLFK